MVGRFHHAAAFFDVLANATPFHITDTAVIERFGVTLRGGFIEPRHGVCPIVLVHVVTPNKELRLGIAALGLLHEGGIRRRFGSGGKGDEGQTEGK